MLLGIFIFASIAIYLIIGGYSHSSIQRAMKPNCRWRRIDRCDADCGHSVVAGLSNILWPIIIPILAGQVLGYREHKPRTIRRQEKELAAAQHKIEVAKLEAQRIEILEREVGIR